MNRRDWLALAGACTLPGAAMAQAARTELDGLLSRVVA